MINPSTVVRPRVRPFVLLAYLLAAATPLACGLTVAAAGDMAMNNMSMSNMPMKAAATAPVYQWSGCYAGLNAGGGAASANFTTTVDPGGYLVLPADAAEVTNDGTGSANISDFLGGGQAGCNWQSGTVVAGLEGDFDHFHSTSAFFNNTDMISTGPFVIGQSVTTNYVATVRPRIGIAADRNFAYVTGGVAFTDASYTESYSDSGGGAGSASASKFLTGWTAGAGWEYALTDHWLLRFEYLFAAFPTTSATGVITGPGPTSNPLHGSADLVLQVARAGMNFKF